MFELPCTLINWEGFYIGFSDGVNFQQGVIDVFEGYDLQDCRNITIPNHDIGMITLIHSGTDAWTPEWISLLFDDSTYIMCPDNEGQLDNNMSHDLYNCY